MDQQTIQQIATFAIAASKDIKSDFPVVMLPKEMSLHSLEGFNAHRNQFRAEFNTQRFASFVDYARANTQPNTQCFIDQSDMSALVVFDMGNVKEAGHAKHRAALEMKKTVAYQALCDLQGKKLSQKTFSDFLEDWAGNLKAYCHNDEMTVQSAVQAVRKMTIDYARNEEHEVGDFAAKKSAMESVEAKSALQLPTHFEFACNPYNGLDVRTFNLRLSVLTGSGEPVLVARLIQAEKIEEAVTEEFAEKLTEALSNTEIKVNIGTIDI